MYERFIKELLRWNKTHKLTNYNEEEIKEQIEDSLFPIKEFNNPKTAIDIGTGAGFPGLILAMAMPETTWYLVEPLKKRYSFLNYIKTILNLKNVKVIPSRLENSNLEKVDLITSRAVMPTKEILEIAKPFIKEDGIIVLYKGSNLIDEIKDLNINAKIVSKNNRNYLFIKG
jgi:16S rRNA (guanine527-N7)-methyltransferase